MEGSRSASQSPANCAARAQAHRRRGVVVAPAFPSRAVVSPQSVSDALHQWSSGARVREGLRSSGHAALGDASRRDGRRARSSRLMAGRSLTSCAAFVCTRARRGTRLSGRAIMLCTTSVLPCITPGSLGPRAPCAGRLGARRLKRAFGATASRQGNRLTIVPQLTFHHPGRSTRRLSAGARHAGSLCSGRRFRVTKTRGQLHREGRGQSHGPRRGIVASAAGTPQPRRSRCSQGLALSAATQCRGSRRGGRRRRHPGVAHLRQFLLIFAACSAWEQVAIGTTTTSRHGRRAASGVAGTRGCLCRSFSRPWASHATAGGHSQ